MALVNALVPVLYAFSLLALVISTFAVIATDMFASLVGAVKNFSLISRWSRMCSS